VFDQAVRKSFELKEKIMRVRKGERAIAAAAMAAVGVLGMVTQRAQAANDVWTGTASNLFNAFNWVGNNPPQSGDSLEFGVPGSSGLTLTDNLTTPGFLIAGITFDSELSSNAFIINPNSAITNDFTLNGNITDNSTSLETINDPFVLNITPTVTVASGGNLALGGVISGSNGLSTGGAGTVTITGADTYTGNINVNSGALVVNLAQTALTNPTTSALGNLQVARVQRYDGRQCEHHDPGESKYRRRWCGDQRRWSVQYSWTSIS
jgi:autotransporter-associated beta strand protein